MLTCKRLHTCTPRARVRLSALATLVASLPLLSLPASAQRTRQGGHVIKLSEVLPRTVVGQVLDDYAFDPTGAHVVFRADQDEHEVVRLYRAPSDGSAEPVELSITLDSSSNVGPLQLSPDGSQVLFTHGAMGLFGPPASLYTVAADGSSPPVRLTPSPPASLQQYEFSPDGSRVIYLAGGGGVHSLGGIYSIPTDAGQPVVRLSPPLPSGHNVTRFQIDGSSGLVVYRADQIENNIFELFSVPLDGSAPPVRINAPIDGSNGVFEFEVVGSAGRVVYSAIESPGRNVYSTPIDGSAGADQLNTPGQALANLQGFRISPDGQQVLVIGDVETFDVSELFRSPIDGSSPPVKLSAPLPTGADINSAEFSPDGSRVVYVGEQETDGRREIYSVPTMGGAAPIKLNQPVAPDGAIQIPSFAGRYTISADSSRVVYEGHQDAIATSSLFSAAIDGSQNLRISTTLPSEQYVLFFEINALSDTVVYRSAIIPSGASSLWSVPILGGPSVHLAGDGNFPEIRLSPTGNEVVYRNPIGAGFELVHKAIDADGPGLPLNTPLPSIAVGDIDSYLISPDERWVVYHGEQEVDGQFELYSVSIDGGPPVKLNPPLEPLTHVVSYAISPDSQWAVFSAGQGSSNGNLLYAAALDGSTGPVLLSAPQAAGLGISVGAAFGQYNGFTISPDALWVAYRSDQAVATRNELFLAPIDGSSGPVRLNAALSGGQDVHPQFEFSPDSLYVVYRADQVADGRHELFSIPVDLSTGPVKLNPTPVAQGDVGYDFKIGPDSQRVAYRADQDTNDTQELYSAPIDGSSPAIKLSGPTPATGGAVELEVPPAGNHAIYLSNHVVDERFRPYTVPLDGSSPAVPLISGLESGANVLNMQFTPDGSRVLYILSQSDPNRWNLYSVPIEGSAAPTLLSAATTDPVAGYTLSGDGTWILFDVYATPNPGLFCVPVDGSQDATLVDFPLAPGRRVVASAIDHDGERLGFIADRDELDQFHAWRISRSAALPPVRMSGRLGPAGDVQDLRLTRNGAKFVYLANRREQSGVELFVGRLLHSATPR